MRVLVFGASITQGFYDTQGGWVGRLWSHYTKQLMDGGPDITIFNLGISGDGSEQMLKRFKNEAEARRFPAEEFAFIFSIGTNNSWTRATGEPVSTPEKYSENIAELIRQAREYSNKLMFVGIAPCDESRARPVPWNKDIFFTNERLMIFDESLKKICEKENIKYIPIFDALKRKLEKEDIYKDGLHPNDAGHQLISELVRPALDQLLNT
jgi:lysophospholipase L1-like esterase